jgi:hypothetical protein
MVGMTTEKFLDALAVDAKLFFQREEHADQRECQLAFGIGHRHSATQLSGLSKELHPARAALGTPQMTGVEKLFPLSFASLL